MRRKGPETLGIVRETFQKPGKFSGMNRKYHSRKGWIGLFDLEVCPTQSRHTSPGPKGSGAELPSRSIPLGSKLRGEVSALNLLIINTVESIAPGPYYHDRLENELALLKEATFRGE